MIFQNPQSSLNPVMTIGQQLIETIMLHNKSLNKKQSKEEAVKLLQDVEIAGLKVFHISYLGE